MKTCKTCGGPLNRGSSRGVAGYRHCLICQVARAMATFVMPKKAKVPQ